jgi:OpgC protein
VARQRRSDGIAYSHATLVIALLYLVFSLALALSWQVKALEAFVPDVLSKLIYPIDKDHFSPLRFLHFLALPVLVARLTPADWGLLKKPPMTAVIRCGENALAIYCLSVLLSFFGLVILTEFSDPIAMQVAVSLFGIAVMIAAATLMTWTSQLGRLGPRLFDSARPGGERQLKNTVNSLGETACSLGNLLADFGRRKDTTAQSIIAKAAPI